MNLGQEFGILQLRIADLEEGGAVAAGDSPMVARLQAMLGEARRGESQALTLAQQEREAREKAEAALKAALAADAPLVASLKSTVRALEATIRGKDMQLSEAARKLDAAEQRAKAMQPTQPCPVCAAVRAAMVKVEREDDVHTTRHAIREVLARAERPLRATEIAERANCIASVVSVALPRMHKRGELHRYGESGRGMGTAGAGYRYWLAARPLPKDDTTTGETTAC